MSSIPQEQETTKHTAHHRRFPPKESGHAKHQEEHVNRSHTQCSNRMHIRT